MESVLVYLKENPVFFLATADGVKPRVRPFGFIMQRAQKLYFCTSKNKEVYSQLVANQEVELSAMGKDSSWIRVRGTIAFDHSKESKAQAFTESPQLLRIYPKGADDDFFTTFYFEKAEAILYRFGEKPVSLKLL